jgi:hypothetical protein
MVLNLTSRLIATYQVDRLEDYKRETDCRRRAVQYTRRGYFLETNLGNFSRTEHTPVFIKILQKITQTWREDLTTYMVTIVTDVIVSVFAVIKLVTIFTIKPMVSTGISFKFSK